MKTRMLSIVLSILASCASSAYAQAGKIEIEIISLTQEKTYDDKLYCKPEYIITNNGIGDLVELRIKLVGINDRGRKLDDFGFYTAIENERGFDKEVVKQGESKAFNAEGGFEEDCAYVKEIEVQEMEITDCNIRQLPNNARCDDQFIIRTRIADIVIR